MDALVLIGSFVLLMLIGLPVAYCLGLAALIGALWIDLPLDAVMIQIGAGVNKFSLLAIPFFVLAGAIMAEGGMARRLVAFAGGLRARWPVLGQHHGLDLFWCHLRHVGGRHRLDRLGADPRDGKKGLSPAFCNGSDRQRLGAGHLDPAQP